MKRLLCLRHAKSSWDDPALDDHDRPLAPRGHRAAPIVGKYIEQHGLIPDKVLCSSARRARETLDLASAPWPVQPRKEIDRGLYLTGVEATLAILGRSDDRLDTILLVGHNPDMEQLVAMVAKRGDSAGRKALARKYPTAALAVIDLPLDHWADVAPGTGILERFVIPKDLM